MDSARHSGLTCAQPGVCRKLALERAATWRGVLGGRDGPDGQGGRVVTRARLQGPTLVAGTRQDPRACPVPAHPRRRSRGPFGCVGAATKFPKVSWAAAPAQSRPAPREGRTSSTTGSSGPAAAAAAATAARTPGTASRGTSATTAPPKPPPVIRAPRAPPASAAATVRSTTGTEFSKSSRIEACEAVISGPMRGQLAATGEVDAVQDPLVLGEHVPRPPPGLVVGEGREGSADVVDLAQRGHPQLAGRALAGVATRRVAAVGELVRGVRVDDEQGQAGRVEVAGDGLDGEVAGVEEGQVVGPRAQDRGLVEQAGRGADVVVLGALDEQGELLAGHLRAGEAEQGQRDGALQGVAGGQAAAAGHVAGDHQVGPGQRSAEPLAEHPGDARDVRRPAGDVARLRVGGEVRRAPGRRTWR